MVRELQVLHLDHNERRRLLPAARMGQVPLAERGAVWQPSRHPSQRSIATWWWSATSGRHVGCRSLERMSVAMLLDFHSAVVDFSAWSAQLVWRERGRERRLVPDFVVRTASGDTLVVACPPAAGPAHRFRREVEVLREACGQAGWLLAAPRLPSGAALANLRWISRRRHPRYGDSQVEQALTEAFAQPRPLAEGVEDCGLPRALVLPRLYHMLWHQRLGVQWHEPLGPGALVGPPHAISTRASAEGALEGGGPLAVERS